MTNVESGMTNAMDVLVQRTSGKSNVVPLYETMHEMRRYIGRCSLSDEELIGVIVHYATSAGSAVHFDGDPTGLRLRKHRTQKSGVSEGTGSEEMESVRFSR